FKTTSFETISNLKKSLLIFEQMFKRVDGLPLELRVMAATKQIPGGGTTTQPIVTLVLASSMDAARQIAADAAAESRKFLPAGRELDHATYLEAVVVEMEQEAKAYAGEFLPKGEMLEGEKEDVREMREISQRALDSDRDRQAHELVLEEGVEGDGTGEALPPIDEEHPDEERESGGGPSVEADPSAEAGAGPEGQDNDETPSSDEKDDSDRNDPDPEPEIEEYDADDYELATKVLAAADGWTAEAIRDRLEYHRKTGTLDRLLERLEKNMPEAWAAVAEADEPDDGLAS
ncbi:hypothetical protein LCGC14_2651790, partial [marine sediment metagenome]